MINENPLLQSQGLEKNLRYTLCSNMMNEYFLQFINQANTVNLIESLIKECKKNNINLVRNICIFTKT